MQNYGKIVAENTEKNVSPDGFFCIQILPEINFAGSLGELGYQ